MISIIVPTLNEEKYVANLLDDLASQSNKDFEVIIVDAKSEDKTIKVCEHFKDAFALKIITSDIRRSSTQKNLGANEAKGEWLFFLDADITFNNKDYLKNLDLNNCIAAHPAVSIKKGERTLGDYIFILPLNAFINVMNKIMPAGSRGIQLIKKDVFNKTKFNEDLAVAEDVDFFARVKQHGKIKFIPTPVFESPRRYRKDGHIRTIMKWCINGVWAKLFKKSFHKNWREAR